jgi:hypothetical protein
MIRGRCMSLEEGIFGGRFYVDEYPITVLRTVVIKYMLITTDGEDLLHIDE